MSRGELRSPAFICRSVRANNVRPYNDVTPVLWEDSTGRGFCDKPRADVGVGPYGSQDVSEKM